MRKIYQYGALAMLLPILLLCGCSTDKALSLEDISFAEEQETSQEKDAGDESYDAEKADDALETAEDSRVILSEDAAESKVTKDSAEIFVYVCGAVLNPGVYGLPEGSRGCDALEAAGGFDDGADREQINLAALLSDGSRLYFPYEGEEAEVSQAATSAENTESAGGEESSLVNINTAGLEQLMTVPGIGEKRAQAIIDYRSSGGYFENPEDLMNISGIGESVYLKMKNYICVR